jgi:hypothetical protein
MSAPQHCVYYLTVFPQFEDAALPLTCYSANYHSTKPIPSILATTPFSAFFPVVNIWSTTSALISAVLSARSCEQQTRIPRWPARAYSQQTVPPSTRTLRVHEHKLDTSSIYIQFYEPVSTLILNPPSLVSNFQLFLLDFQY